MLFQALAILMGLSIGTAQLEMPTMPHYDYAACPFDCCSYGTWKTLEETPLRGDHSDASPIVSVVKMGEDVTGTTGVVITTQAGEVRILRETTMNVENSLEEIALQPGDIVYDLRYMGEGYDKFYFSGIYLIGRTNISRTGNFGSWQVVSLPQWVWWAHVRRNNGETGWTRELGHFDNIDACE